MSWQGKPNDFKTPTETALAFEGMRNRESLQAAGWQSLASYVAANVHLIELGERAAPGLAPKTIEADAELRNPTDHADAKHAGYVESIKNLERELADLQRQRENARGGARIEIEARMRPIKQKLDSMKRWKP